MYVWMNVLARIYTFLHVFKAFFIIKTRSVLQNWRTICSEKIRTSDVQINILLWTVANLLIPTWMHAIPGLWNDFFFIESSIFCMTFCKKKSFFSTFFILKITRLENSRHGLTHKDWKSIVVFFIFIFFQFFNYLSLSKVSGVNYTSNDYYVTIWRCTDKG